MRQALGQFPVQTVLVVPDDDFHIGILKAEIDHVHRLGAAVDVIPRNHKLFPGGILRDAVIFHGYLVFAEKGNKLVIAAVDIRNGEDFFVVWQNTFSKELMLSAGNDRGLLEIVALDLEKPFDGLIFLDAHEGGAGLLDVNHRPAVHGAVLSVFVEIRVIE